MTAPKRWALPLFFLLSLGITWSIWLPQAGVALGFGNRALPLNSPLMLVAVWGPGLAAIIVTLLAAGRSGVWARFRPLHRWRVGLPWYLVALFLPATVWVAGRAVDTLIGLDYTLRSPLEALGPGSALVLPALILFALPNTLGEELGWRGFALPHLQERHTALGASVVLGLFWALWHLPTLIAQGAVALSLVPLLLYVLGFVALTLIYTWIFNGTGGSLLLAWLFHASDAITQYLLPRLPSATDELLVILVALLIVAVSGATHLSRRPILDAGARVTLHER